MGCIQVDSGHWGYGIWTAFMCTFLTSVPSELFKILPNIHPFTHTHTHTHTDVGVIRAGRQPARQEQLG